MKPSSQELDALVEATDGPKPLRRLFHAATGLTVAAGLTWLDLPRGVTLPVLGGAFVGLLALDLLRLRFPGVNALFFRAVPHLASPREAGKLASSTWYALSLFLAVAIFPLPAAVTGILVLALADPAASYLGRRFGRRPFLGGSVEGSLVFLAVAAALILLRHPWPVALVAAPLTALVERLSWPLDDNLTVPVATAGAVALLEGLL